MRMRYLAAISAALLAAAAGSGCSPANEESIGGQTSVAVAPAPGQAQYSSYGEMMQKKTQEIAEAAKAAKKTRKKK